MSLSNYENVEKSKIWYILVFTHPSLHIHSLYSSVESVQRLSTLRKNVIWDRKNQVISRKHIHIWCIKERWRKNIFSAQKIKYDVEKINCNVEKSKDGVEIINYDVENIQYVWYIKQIVYNVE